MDPNYEIVRYKHGLNARMLIHGVSRYKLHWHKEIELLLVIKGSVQVIVGGQGYNLEQDDLLFINSGEMHSTIGGEDNIVVAVQINPEFCSKNYPDLEKCQFLWPAKGSRDPVTEEAVEGFYKQLRMFIARIVDEYRKTETGYQLAIEGIINALMTLVVRNVPVRKLPDTPEAEHTKDTDRLRRIIEYIQQHYMERITLKDLADEAYLSSYYFSHFFKEKIGISFQEYLNYVRLQNAATLLSQTEKRITDIALDCGFSGIKTFNRIFKDHFGISPREHRSQRDFFAAMAEESSYLEFDSLHALEKLHSYLDIDPVQVDLQRIPLAECIRVDTAKPGRPLFPEWKPLAAVGRAYDCLRGDLQEQIRCAVRDLGTAYLRFHGIFDDEMRVVTRNDDGALRFYWGYVDKVFDFLTGIGVHPLADLTFVPDAMKSQDKTVFRYKGNISPPRDMAEWEQLIYRFALHCIDRYGLDEVRQWYFEVWNEPDLMWMGTQDDYFSLFRATAEGLRKADPALRIAGPAVIPPIESRKNWIDAFIDFLNVNKLPLPCFTFHIYGEKDFLFYGAQDAKFIASLGGKSHFSDCIDFYREKATHLTTMPDTFLVTEYNVSAQHGNYLLDTMFAACHLLYNYLKNHDRVQGIAFWTLSEIFEEDVHSPPPFSGGFGLVSAEGIRKPTWYALWFLRRIRGQILKQGEEYIVTKRDNSVYILAFRYLFYDKMFLEGDHSLLHYDDRYGVFEGKGPVSLNITLQNIQGPYQVREYTLDRGHGSAFDLFAEMGLPQSLSASDTDYLREAARPALTIRTIQAAGEITIPVTLEPHGIKLIEINPCPYQ
jgi:xylan 1,4-beta-xylosidase